MITTREINVDLAKEKLKLRQVSTKNVDASLRVEPPKEPIKRRGISTTNIADVADIIEKKRRDDIAVEKEKEGNLYVDEKGFKKLNMQFVFVDVDGLVQAISRRELK